MSKIAICLHGLSEGRNDKGDVVSHTRSFKNMQKNILDVQECDVFLHTWSNDEDHVASVKKLYKPCSAEFEKKVMFDESPSKLHSVKSKWYSYKKSVELKKKREESQGFTYDFVFVTRFDNCFCTPLVFKEYSTDCFYSSNWEYPHNIKGFLDLWFFSGSKDMDKFSTLFDSLDSYLADGHELSNHTLSKTHAKVLNLNMVNTKFENIDFGLERSIAGKLDEVCI